MINEIMQSYVLDLVLSGINRGANVSKNITYSDAVTAVMKGAFRCISAIELIQQVAGHKAIKMTVKLIGHLQMVIGVPLNKELIGRIYPQVLLGQLMMM